MFENNPNVPTEELLSQIKSACLTGLNSQVDPITIIIPPFSALLVNLSNEATENANKNIAVQERMITITAIILTISVIQLVNLFLTAAGA